MRVKRGVRGARRRKKVLARASGFRGSNSRCFVTALEKSDRALAFAYRDRKQKKRNFRRLWTQRINAAAREFGVSYSKLMGALNKQDIKINRKVLAHLAVVDKEAFGQIVKQTSLIN